MSELKEFEKVVKKSFDDAMQSVREISYAFLDALESKRRNEPKKNFFTATFPINGTTNGQVDVAINKIGNNAVVQAAAGKMMVGIEGNTGAIIDGVINGAAPANVLWETVAPSTAASAACSVSAQAALTVINVKASAGNVYGIHVFNGAAATTFLQFYNTAGVPTLGTAVVWSIGIPAGQSIVIPVGAIALANFATGIGIGAATTYAGAVAPATAPQVTIFFR